MLTLYRISIQFITFLFVSIQFSSFPFDTTMTVFGLWTNTVTNGILAIVDFFSLHFIPVFEYAFVCDALDMVNYWHFFWIDLHTDYRNESLPLRIKLQFSMQLNTGKLFEVSLFTRFFDVWNCFVCIHTITLCGMNVDINHSRPPGRMQFNVCSIRLKLPNY